MEKQILLLEFILENIKERDTKESILEFLNILLERYKEADKEYNDDLLAEDRAFFPELTDEEICEMYD